MIFLIFFQLYNRYIIQSNFSQFDHRKSKLDDGKEMEEILKQKKYESTHLSDKIYCYVLFLSRRELIFQASLPGTCAYDMTQKSTS